MNNKRLALFSFLVPALLAGCLDSSSDEDAGFGHNSPRPACEYLVDAGRVPYFAAPVVVAGGWGAPVKLAAPLNTACPEDAVEISADGKTLYFYWSPTVNGSAEVLLDVKTGTYRAERVGSDPAQFADPRLFGLYRGAEGGSVDGQLAFTPDGSKVYFHSTRAANTGYQQVPAVDDILDIYVAEIVNGVPGVAVNLGAPVNTIYIDGEHGLSPDGTKLYISSNRPGGVGGVDLWVSTYGVGGWGAPVNMGAAVNSVGDDLQPAFAAGDANTLYFTSDRAGPSSIYRTVFNGVSWSTPEMIITGYVGEPSLVSDGKTLYFVHVLVDDDGVFGSDIWYVQKP